MDFILVQGGCFANSNPTPGESAPTSGKTCVKDFWLGIFEVSQSDWTRAMQNNPAYFQKGGDFPVENISFLDIQNYLKKLNQFGEYTFRLPTEAEWEYACKSGGNKETYAGGENPDSLAWYKANSGDSSHAVGRKMPNGLGLFDMSGNVEEWVQDYYDEGKTEKEEFHVIRGGSWSYKEKFIRCDRRGYGSASSKEKNLGLRLVIEKK
jgi:formylglycine-generating enzyme required for sulfatase activity